jgi:hypothetical protein
LHVKKPGSSTKTLIANNISATSFNHKTLLAGTHTFYIQACDTVKGCGESAIQSVRTDKIPAPGQASKPVIGVTKQPINKSLAINWARTANATSYRLYENGQLIYNNSNISTSRSQNKVGVKNYTVAACNLGGCGAKSADTAVNYYQLPNAVASFTSNKTNINHGESIVLNWTKPSGYSGSLIYNLYVTKPGLPKFLWKSGQTDYTEIRGGDTGIQRTGTQVIEIEACNNLGICGNKKSVSVTVGGPPPIPWTFTVNKSIVKQGDTVKFNWAMHHNYIKGTRYKLYVKKPGSSTNTLIANNTSATSFSHKTLLAGTHTFYVQACDTVEGCGASKTLVLNVESTKPNKVADFKAIQASINHGESLEFHWQQPVGNVDDLSYKIYVTKPYESGYPVESRKLWLSGLKTNSDGLGVQLRGGDTGIQRSGKHIFEIEACNQLDDCSEPVKTEVVVGGPPPALWEFKGEPESILAGQTVKLSWAMHHNYQKDVTYNLYVDKPDGTARFKFQSNISETTFTRLIYMSGEHVFHIQACDPEQGCSALKPLKVAVIGVYKDATGSLYIKINNHNVKLLKGENNWSSTLLTDTQWDNLTLTPLKYIVETGDFNSDGFTDFKLISVDKNVTLIALGHAAGYQIQQEIKINIISTDLIGTPTVNNNSGVN